MSDDWKTIEFGGTADEFLGEIIDRYLEMMLRAARAIFSHASVDGGAPAGRRA